MKKKLLLTLLPLAFLVAACSGAQEGIQSSSAAKSSSAAATSSAAGDTSSAEDTSSEEEVPEGARTEPVGQGYEIKVGDYYYQFTEFGPDEGYLVSLKAEDLSLTAGDEVKLFLNGEGIGAWAQADKDRGIYPNYDERNPDSGATVQEKFTVTETATGIAYLHQNNNEAKDYSFWLTPEQIGGTEGGGEGGGEAVVNAYAIYAGDTKLCDLTLDGTKDYQNRDQGVATNVALTTGQEICLKNTGTGDTWICAVEGYSFGGTSESSTTWTTYLTAGTSTWTVLQDVTVDIYAKFAWENDSIYFGIHKA